MKTLSKGNGEIYLLRRPQKLFSIDSYGPCPFCMGWVLKINMFKHQKKCEAADTNVQCLNTASLITQSDVLSSRITTSPKKLVINEVFTCMKRDEVGLLARSDYLIVALGNQWMEKNIGNALKRGVYTSQIMRLAAKLLLHLREVQPQEQNSLWDYLTPQNFDNIVKATLLTCAPNIDDEDDLVAPSNAIKLGYDLKRMINIKIGMSAIRNLDNDRRVAKLLMKTMNVFWATKVNKMARVLLQERNFNKTLLLPDASDICQLTEYLKSRVEYLSSQIDDIDITYDVYQKVAKTVLARLLLFNRRRSGEMEAARLENYVARKCGTDIPSFVIDQCTDIEKVLLKTQEVFDIRGKKGRGVPVIVPEDTKKLLKVISSSTVREQVSVKSKYLFSKAQDSAHKDRVFSAYSCLQEFSVAADLKAPDRITSTNLRKYMATCSQTLDLTNAEIDWITNHLGHNLDIHKIFYRQTSEVIEKTQVAKILLLQDCNNIAKYQNKHIKDITFEDLVYEDATSERENNEERETNNNYYSQFTEQSNTTEGDIFDDDLMVQSENFFADEESAASGTKKSRRAPDPSCRQKWTEKEETEIQELFAQNLQHHVKPSPKEIRHKQQVSKRHGGLIHTRTLSALKNKVYRMLKATM